jgi:hypothetical protein
MKKEDSILLLSSATNNNAEWSPHMIMQPETKHQSWATSSSFDGESELEDPAISFQALSLQHQTLHHPRTTQDPYIVSVEDDVNQGRGCESDDSDDALKQDLSFPAPISRKVSLEPEAPVSIDSSLSASSQDALSRNKDERPACPKRRRNSSMACEEPEFKTHKRRRLHARKPALVSTDFDQILSQIGSLFGGL